MDDAEQVAILSRDDAYLQSVKYYGLLVCSVTTILWTAFSMLVLLVCMLKNIHKHIRAQSKALVTTGR